MYKLTSEKKIFVAQRKKTSHIALIQKINFYSGDTQKTINNLVNHLNIL